MKNKLLLFVVFAFLASPVFGQFAFSASPGLHTNGATFGYKAGKVVPYVGLQVISAKLSLSQNSFNWTGVVMEQSKSKITVNANVIMPTIGAKYFFIEKNKLKAYANIAITKPFISAKYSANTDGIVSPIDSTIAAEVKKAVKDIKIIGGQVGFGVEYFFDDNFSLGGEFGFGYMRAKYTRDNVQANFQGSGQTVTETLEAKVNIVPTYTKISLNFYFGGGGGKAAVD